MPAAGPISHFTLILPYMHVVVGSLEPGESYVALLYYSDPANPYQVIDGIICAGTRSQPSLAVPGMPVERVG